MLGISVALVVEAVWAIGCVADVSFQVLIFAENVLVFFVENNGAAVFICTEVLSKFLAKELLFALVKSSTEDGSIKISNARLNHRWIFRVIGLHEDCIYWVEQVLICDSMNIDMVL